MYSLHTPATHVRLHSIFPPLPGSPSLPSAADLYICDLADIFFILFSPYEWWHFFHSCLSPNLGIFIIVPIAYSVDTSQHPHFCCIHPSSILCVTGQVSQPYMSVGIIDGSCCCCTNFAECLGRWSQYPIECVFEYNLNAHLGNNTKVWYGFIAIEISHKD